MVLWECENSKAGMPLIHVIAPLQEFISPACFPFRLGNRKHSFLSQQLLVYNAYCHRQWEIHILH
jgi:hypothetical protein